MIIKIEREVKGLFIVYLILLSNKEKESDMLLYKMNRVSSS